MPTAESIEAAQTWIEQHGTVMREGHLERGYFLTVTARGLSRRRWVENDTANDHPLALVELVKEIRQLLESDGRAKPT